jgi:hypothetical protein
MALAPSLIRPLLALGPLNNGLSPVLVLTEGVPRVGGDIVVDGAVDSSHQRLKFGVGGSSIPRLP